MVDNFPAKMEGELHDFPPKIMKRDFVSLSLISLLCLIYLVMKYF